MFNFGFVFFSLFFLYYILFLLFLNISLSLFLLSKSFDLRFSSSHQASYLTPFLISVSRIQSLRHFSYNPQTNVPRFCSTFLTYLCCFYLFCFLFYFSLFLLSALLFIIIFLSFYWHFFIFFLFHSFFLSSVFTFSYIFMLFVTIYFLSFFHQRLFIISFSFLHPSSAFLTYA